MVLPKDFLHFKRRKMHKIKDNIKLSLVFEFLDLFMLKQLIKYSLLYLFFFFFLIATWPLLWTFYILFIVGFYLLCVSIWYEFLFPNFYKRLKSIFKMVNVIKNLTSPSIKLFVHFDTHIYKEIQIIYLIFSFHLESGTRLLWASSSC